MGINYADRIYIVTETPERGEEIKASIRLRGFDRIKCYGLSELGALFLAQHPDLFIIDAGSQTDETVRRLAALSGTLSPTIWMVDRYEEEQFLTCYDAGAKDYLVKPVSPAYLISRVLLALDERHLSEQLVQRDLILQELSVISAKTGLFTRDYFLQYLERERVGLKPEGKLVLLLVEFMAPPSALGLTAQQVAELLKQCCRCSDLIGEFGADHQYAVLLPDTDIKGGKTVCDRILSQLQKHLPLPGKGVVGVADATGCSSLEMLLNRAQQAVATARQAAGHVSIITG